MFGTYLNATVIQPTSGSKLNENTDFASLLDEYQARILHHFLLWLFYYFPVSTSKLAGLLTDYSQSASCYARGDSDEQVRVDGCSAILSSLTCQAATPCREYRRP